MPTWACSCVGEKSYASEISARYKRKEGERMMESMMMMAAAIFLLLVLADFSLADTPQGRISGRMYVGSYPAGKPYAPHFPKRGRSKSSIIRQSVSPIHRLHPALPSPSPLSQKQPQSIPLTSRVRNTEIQNRFSADNITGKWWKIKLDKELPLSP